MDTKERRSHRRKLSIHHLCRTLNRERGFSVQGLAGRYKPQALRAFFSSTDPAHITCSTTALASFTKQLSVLFGAGVPLHEALDSLTRVQTDNLSIFVIPELRTMVVNGHRFSNALAKYPKVFPRTYVALVRGSEETGELQLVLNQISEWLEKQDKLQRHVKRCG